MSETMLSALYFALLDAGAHEDHARKAAEAAAVVDHRFGALDSRMATLDGRMSALEGRMAGLESRFTGLEGRMSTVTWMGGITVTFTVLIFGALLGLFWKVLAL